MLHLIFAVWVVLLWATNGDVSSVYGTFSTAASADNFALAEHNLGYTASVDSVALPQLRTRHFHRRTGSSGVWIVIWYNGSGDWQAGVQGVNGTFTSWQNAEFYAEYRCLYYYNQKCIYTYNQVLSP